MSKTISDKFFEIIGWTILILASPFLILVFFILYECGYFNQRKADKSLPPPTEKSLSNLKT